MQMPAAAVERSSLSVLGFSSGVCPSKNSTLKMSEITEYLTPLGRLKQSVLVFFKFSSSKSSRDCHLYTSTLLLSSCRLRQSLEHKCQPRSEFFTLAGNGQRRTVVLFQEDYVYFMIPPHERYFGSFNTKLDVAFHSSVSCLFSLSEVILERSIRETER